ncbi:hypothetical protein SY88_15780 [Clostridiales bacterium PH28_bin88]|nr:hypothetical protein SY88_15780 [Clostridiales bacterium PH28_bin88]
MNSLERMLAGKIDRGLANVESAAARKAAGNRRRPLVAAMVERFPTVGPELREAKEKAIDQLRALVEQAEQSLREKGFHVLRARTASEALAYADSLVPAGSLVVKSKSNAAKEIGLVERLESRGIQVVETDLGDRICQVGDIPAAHPLGPAIHVPVDRVAEIFSRQLGRRLEPAHEAIVAAVRESLRHNFLEAEVGISGANAIAADTGSILVMENEGNIRAVTNFPPVHIVVAGIEKIVPTLEDGLKVVKAAALYGTSQDVGSYVSVVSGPSRLYSEEEGIMIGFHGPREVHVILLEMGRFEAADSEYMESLYCINCGHCLRVCSIYGELGEQYGYKYFGGIGLVHAAMRYGLDKAMEGGLSFCLGCRRCVEVCPGKIPVPDMIRSLRAAAVRDHGLSFRKRIVLRRFLPSRRLARMAAPVQGLLFRPVKERKGMQVRFPLILEAERMVPQLASRQLFDMFPEVVPARGRRRARVGYFPGCLGAAAYTHVGAATVEVLARNGIEVWLPPQQVCCGLPMVSAGDLATARRLAETNLKAFDRENLHAIIVDCPTCGTGLRDYQRLFAGDRLLEGKAKSFSAKVRDICQYLWVDLGVEPPRAGLDMSVTYHQPCHLRCDGFNAPLEMLRAIPGVQVLSPPGLDECCGFGGIFSLDYYKLARVIGQRRVAGLAASGAETVVTACPGCMLQLGDGLHQQGSGQGVAHVVEILAASYAREGGR